jgi:tetratricopeptide (TPR) repeat protein
MSYIHDALKKAQREKEIVVDKCAAILSRHRRGRQIFGRLDRQWLVSGCLAFIAVVFSMYSWLNSIGELPSDQGDKVSIHRSAVPSRQSLPSNVSRPLPTREGRAKPQNSQVPRTEVNQKPDRAAPARKDRRSEPRKRPETLTRDRLHESGTTLYQQALALQKKGRFQEAKELYEAALERSPHLVSALNNLGAIYIKEKNLAAARGVLQKAIRTDSSYVDPYYNLACLHALQKDVGRSLFYLKKAISVDKAARKWAKTDEDLKNLRGHVEYEKILKDAQES